MKLETIAIHAGHSVDPASGAVAMPITLSTTFERDPDGRYSRGLYYSTKGNPNRNALEACLAAVEGGEVAVVFASGVAAINAVLRTLRPCDHVLVPDDVFQGTIRLLRDVLPKWGIRYTVVDMTQPDAVRTALQENTKLIWMETLSNPLLKVTDVQVISSIAHEHGALCVVDNSFVTPVFQRPLELGADLVVHATTKYIAGHGDVVGGVVVARNSNSVIEEIRRIQLTEGSVPSPFDCWLVQRGLRTLPCRMRVHAESAMKVAGFLEGHPMVETVFYPGLAHHPQHELASRQLTMFGGIVSILVRGGKEAATAVAGAVQVFTHATSFGGTESLIQHQASSPTHGIDTGLAENLLRLSVGLEHPDDLIADLKQALEVAAAVAGVSA